MYIISYSCTLENIKVQQVVIPAPMEAAFFFAGAEFIRHHYYGIKYKGQKLDIVCPAYHHPEEGDVVILPWYLILGRPYPLQVYLFASSYYSNNPDVGQRGAAEATRLKFNLKTFSHTTVGRSFRTIEEARKSALDKRFGEEIKIRGAEGLTIVKASPKTADVEPGSDIDRMPHSKMSFPTVADTAQRREAMSGFLPKFQKDAKTVNIEAAGRQFLKDWYEKSRRRLL